MAIIKKYGGDILWSRIRYAIPVIGWYFIWRDLPNPGDILQIYFPSTHEIIDEEYIHRQSMLNMFFTFLLAVVIRLNLNY